MSINAPAERCLDDIVGEWPSNFDVPVPVIAAAARVMAPDLDGSVESAVARLPSKRGGWISVQASRLRGRNHQVVVLLQPPRARRRADGLSTGCDAHSVPGDSVTEWRSTGSEGRSLPSGFELSR